MFINCEQIIAEITTKTTQKYSVILKKAIYSIIKKKTRELQA